MIDIINRQRKRKLSTARWREYTSEVLRTIKRDGVDVSIVFATDDTIRKLNQQFRGNDYVTDVLSFPTAPEGFEKESSLGEIVISVERAAIQAKQNGLLFANEIEQLILHGLLHLCGYDHETDKGEMNRLELKLRKKLGI